MALGVYYVPLGIALNLTEPDLGVPSLPDLWDQLYRKPVREILQCLECRDNAPACPEWMYLRVRNGRREAVHLNPGIKDHDAPESDEHKALKERIATAAAGGGFAVEVEARATHGRRITDVLVHGRDITLGFEAQLSPISVASVTRRSRIAVTDDITPVWTTTDRQATVIDRAPWARIDRLPWQEYLSQAELPVRGGVRRLVIEQCSRMGVVCPDKKASRKCSGWHGRWEPREIRRFDDLIVYAAGREYLSIKQRTSKQKAFWFWASAEDVAKLDPADADDAQRTEVDKLTTIVRQYPRPLDWACRYGEEVAFSPGPARVGDSGATIATAPIVRPAVVVLDWSHARHYAKTPMPCRVCKSLTYLRDEAGQPCDKTCAEAELSAVW